jgi:hypothetical protein
MKLDRCLQTFLFAVPLVLLARYMRPEAATKLDEPTFMIMKAEAFPVHDIVVAGDSRVKQGVSPDIMKRTFPGKTILNFGFNGACMNREFVMAAADKLKWGHKDMTLVLCISPSSLAPLSRRVSEYNVHAKTPGTERFFRRYLMPLSRYFDPYPVHRDAPRVSHAVDEMRPDGWEAVWVSEEDPTNLMRSYREIFTGNTYSPPILEELASCVRELSGRGIRVVAFRAPAHFEIIKIEDEMSGWDEDKIRKTLVDAGALWLQFDPANYHYYDGSHMQPQSAQQFSEDLAKVLNSL